MTTEKIMFDNFKFNIGDIVRHKTFPTAKPLYETYCDAVVIYRSLNEGPPGQFWRSYGLSTPNGELYDYELVLELVRKAE